MCVHVEHMSGVRDDGQCQSFHRPLLSMHAVPNRRIVGESQSLIRLLSSYIWTPISGAPRLPYPECLGLPTVAVARAPWHAAPTLRTIFRDKNRGSGCDSHTCRLISSSVLIMRINRRKRRGHLSGRAPWHTASTLTTHFWKRAGVESSMVSRPTKQPPELRLEAVAEQRQLRLSHTHRGGGRAQATR
jgi:hypothetical protein